MKEIISDLFSKITDNEGGFESLLKKVPGISGYMEKGQRREADQILRSTIAERLEASRVKLGTAVAELSRDIIAAIEHAEPLGRVDNRLMGLTGKIKDAPVGYVGFFDAIKVKEEELAQIYAFDEGMLNHADQIEADVNALSKAVRDSGDIGGAISTLSSSVTAANETFDARNEILIGIE